jgi:hypothetical protein
MGKADVQLSSLKHENEISGNIPLKFFSICNWCAAGWYKNIWTLEGCLSSFVLGWFPLRPHSGTPTVHSMDITGSIRLKLQWIHSSDGLLRYTKEAFKTWVCQLPFSTVLIDVHLVESKSLRRCTRRSDSYERLRTCHQNMTIRVRVFTTWRSVRHLLKTVIWKATQVILYL